MTFEGNAKDGKSVQTLHKPKVPKNITIFAPCQGLIVPKKIWDSWVVQVSCAESLGILSPVQFV